MGKEMIRRRMIVMTSWKREDLGLGYLRTESVRGFDPELTRLMESLDDAVMDVVSYCKERMER